MSDPFASYQPGLESPARNAASAVGTAVGTAVVTLTPPSRALYVGGAGNVVATIGGATVTFVAVPAGSILPVRASSIGTATTATQIVSLW